MIYSFRIEHLLFILQAEYKPFDTHYTQIEQATGAKEKSYVIHFI